MKGLFLKIIGILVLLINTLLLFALSAGWLAYGLSVQIGFILLAFGIIGIVAISFIKQSANFFI